MLREYPSHSVNKDMRTRIYERAQAQVQSRVARAEGGLLLLELRENKVWRAVIAGLGDRNSAFIYLNSAAASKGISEIPQKQNMA